MNGNALLLPRREDFSQRIPGAGDVMFNVLQNLTSSRQGINDPEVDHQRSRHADDRSGDVMTSLSEYSDVGSDDKSQIITDVPCSSAEVKLIKGATSSLQNIDIMRLPLKKRSLKNVEGFRIMREMKIQNDDSSEARIGEVSECISKTLEISKTDNSPLSDVTVEDTSNDRSQTGSKDEANGHSKLLWEFLAELLDRPQSPDLPVHWLDRSSMTFRISAPGTLAEMWGEQKRKGNMTYEKLSRALRYYYKTKIISKVPGQKLTYRYLIPPPDITKGVRGAKPGVPHKRRKEPKRLRLESEPNASMSEALDLSVKRSKKSPVKCKKKKRQQVAASACSSDTARS